MIEKVILIDVDTLKSQNIMCGDFKMNVDKTQFTHRSNKNSSSTTDVIFSKTNRNLLNNTISFITIFRDSKEALDFKRFINKYDANFILQITKDDKDYYAYVDKNTDIVSGHNAVGGFENMQIILNQNSLWLAQEEIKFEYTDNQQVEVGYASEPDSVEPDEYHYDITYASTPNTLENFTVELPDFESDFPIYIGVVMEKILTEPAYGLNGRWNEKQTKYSYKAKNTFQLGDDDSLVVMPFPLMRGIWVQDVYPILHRGVDREGDEFREITKVINKNERYLDPYITIEPYTTDNNIIFTNVKKGRIYAIKQFANI